MRYTTHVKNTVRSGSKGEMTTLTFGGEAISQINQQILEHNKIVTFYPSLSEYRFDTARGAKYTTLNVFSTAGYVERFDFDTFEIVVQLDEDVLERHGIGNLAREENCDLETYLAEHCRMVMRGLFARGNDGSMATVIKFICFDIIPNQGKEEM